MIRQLLYKIQKWVGRKRIESCLACSLEVKFQNGTQARFVLPVRALKLLEEEQVDLNLLKTSLNSPSKPLDEQRVENLLLSNVTISSAKLQRLWLSEAFAGPH